MKKKISLICLSVVFFSFLSALYFVRPYVKHIVATPETGRHAYSSPKFYFNYAGKAYLQTKGYVYRNEILTKIWVPHSEGFLVYDQSNMSLNDTKGLLLLHFDRNPTSVRNAFGESRIVYETEDTLIAKRGDTLDVFVFRDRDK